MIEFGIVLLILLFVDPSYQRDGIWFTPIMFLLHIFISSFFITIFTKEYYDNNDTNCYVEYYYVFPISMYSNEKFNLQQAICYFQIILSVFVSIYGLLLTIILWLLYSCLHFHGLDIGTNYPFTTKLLKFNLVIFISMTTISLVFTTKYDVKAIESICCFLICNVYLIDFFSHFYNTFSNMHINSITLIIIFGILNIILAYESLLNNINNLEPINFLCLAPQFYYVIILCYFSICMNNVFDICFDVMQVCLSNILFLCCCCFITNNRENYENIINDDRDHDNINRLIINEV